MNAQLKHVTSPIAVLNEPLHVGRPNIGDRKQLQKRIDDILDRRWLTNNGIYVQQFEKRVSEYLGVKQSIAMCNGTIALEIAIRALGLSGEVIVPSFTFIATANALQWQEITPVFCDVDPKTHTIDPQKVEALITPRTTGIIGVHLWGRCCDIDELTDIARRRNLKLLFDSSHAFGCTYKGRHAGGYGNAEVFSFHATKYLNAIEGGAIATNDSDLAKKIRLMKNFGFTNYDQTEYIGINGKMNEFSAAMGLTNMESMDEFVQANIRNYRCYQKELQNIPGISLMPYDAKEKSNYQYIVLEIEQAQTGISRDQLMKTLHANNILARRYFYPGCHRMQPYCAFFPHAGLLLPETEKLCTKILCLPTGTAVGENDIHRICDIIRNALAIA